MRKRHIIILLTFLFLSCADQDSPNIQDIVNKWTDIDRRFAADTAALADSALVDFIDDFSLSLEEFRQSELYRTYSAIPFSQPQNLSFSPHPPTDIKEVRIVSDLALLFRDSIVSGDMEKARAVSAEISGALIRLLMIDRDVQRYIGSSYFRLLITLIVFIVITALFILVLHRSLSHSLKLEAEGRIFSHSYMLAQEEERARISRELHDTVIQDMHYFLLETEKIGNTGEKSEREALSDKTVPMMADLIRKTRDICNDLIPPDFRFNELPDSLRKLCFDFGKRSGIDCHADIMESINLDFLNEKKRLQIFRIVQEALNNIEKHAGANKAIVILRLGPDGDLFIGISDDGKGFAYPPSSSDIIPHQQFDRGYRQLGIRSMKERAVILGGSLKIITEEGEGTLICLEIPPPVTHNAKET